MLKIKFGIFLLLILSGCASAVEEAALPTLAVLPSLTPTIEPTQTAIPPTSTITDTPAPTPTATPSSTNTIEPSKTSTFTPTATITDTPIPPPTATVTQTPSPLPTFTTVPKVRRSEEEILKSYIGGFAEGTVYSVQIADGRSNGGQRVAIIAYVTAGSTVAEIAREIGLIIGSIASAMKNETLDIDAYSVIYGLSPDTSMGIASVNASDLIAYINGSIDEGQLWSRITFVDM